MLYNTFILKCPQNIYLRALVRVARLERAASTSQMSRATNCTTPGYKIFGSAVCGQSGFSDWLSGLLRSRKRPCFKGFPVSLAPIADIPAYAPKAGALPTAQHPAICSCPGIGGRTQMQHSTDPAMSRGPLNKPPLSSYVLRAGQDSPSK